MKFLAVVFLAVLLVGGLCSIATTSETITLLVCSPCTTEGHHDKVYSATTYATNPPCTAWICRRCGARGEDCEKYYDYDEYGRLQKLWPEKWGK